jgi:RND family efflux transporter MFP subunit
LSLHVATLSAEAPAQPVRVDVVLKEKVQQRRFVLGEIKAVSRSVVASRESGIVSSMHVEEGQHVRKGDLLITLNDEHLQLDILEAREDEKVAQAVIKEHQAVLKLRAWKFETFQELKKRGSGQESEIREAESALSVAQAKIALAQTQLGVAQARLKRLERRLADMKLLAPFDSRVISKLTERGQWMADGGKVVEIVSTGEVEARFDVPEGLAQHLSRADTPISLRVEAQRDRVFETSSYRLIPDVHSKSKTFPLVVRLTDKADLLHPGMTAMAWLPTGELTEQITISRDAIMWNDRGPYVAVVKKADEAGPSKAELLPISILFYKSDRVIIRPEKILEGDLIVVEGNERLAPGARIRITSASGTKKTDKKAMARE